MTYKNTKVIYNHLVEPINLDGVMSFDIFEKDDQVEGITIGKSVSNFYSVSITLTREDLITLLAFLEFNNLRELL